MTAHPNTSSLRRAMPVVTACLFFLTTVMAAQSPLPSVAANDRPPQGAAGVTEFAPDALLGPGDLIEIRVFGVNELTQTTRLNQSGIVEMPLVGKITIGGLTVEQAQRAVEAKLVSSGLVKEPHVDILVREFTTQEISVMGEVQRPGRFPLIAAHRLMDALSSAGGFAPRAGRDIIITHRNGEPATTVHWSFDPAKMQEANVQLQAGDAISVGRAGIVYVTGEVVKPGGFVLDQSESVTVLQALALAEGAKPTASLNKARLIRKTPQGPQEIPVSLKDITSTKKPDLAMQSDDVLFIPNSAGKSAGRRSLESVLQITSGLLIYHPY